jgi:hypothetical protein
MIVVLAEDQDGHADAVIAALKYLDQHVIRINPEKLDTRLQQMTYHLGNDGEVHGKLIYQNQEIGIHSISAIFCRNYYFEFVKIEEGKSADELLMAKELEACFKGLFESLPSRWMNAPWDMDRCDNKIVQMRVAHELGFKVPELLVTNQVNDLVKFRSTQQVVVKQLSEVCVFEEDGQTAKSLYTHLMSDDDFDHISDLQASPAFFSSFIDKKYDLRVTVVNERLFPVRIYSQEFKESRVDLKRRTGDWKMEICTLPNALNEKILNLMTHFNLQFAAFDFAVDRNGEYWFIEVNSEGNWLWMESGLKLNISQKIAQYLCGFSS